MLSACAPCWFRAITPVPSTVATTIPFGTVPLNALPTITKYSPAGRTVLGEMVARIREEPPTQDWTAHPPMSAVVAPVLRSSTNPAGPSAISFTLTGDTPGVLPNVLPASSTNVATLFPKGVTRRSLAPCAGAHRGPKAYTAWDLWGGRRDGGRRAPPSCGRAGPCRLPALR